MSTKTAANGGIDPRPGVAPQAPATVVSRRRALSLVLAGTASAAALVSGGPTWAASAGQVFAHGVASGDPLTDRVILWTRVTTARSGSVVVRWQVATDAAMTKVVRQGTTLTGPSRDYTVKVDATGLRPATTYHYRFTALGQASRVGRTKTLPLGKVDQLKIAVFSCSDFEDGYFHPYREAALRDDLDAVLHLGDYIYEYGGRGLTSPAILLGLVVQPRLAEFQPAVEATDLGRYRARHALYKTDPDLQELHRKNPMIVVWDDHESANDAWTGGAENHTEGPPPAGEGNWSTRKVFSVQAYYEWMPLREPADGLRIDPVSGNPEQLYRSFDFGDLARIVMLDSRQAGRDRQLAGNQLVGVYAGVTAQGQFPLDVVDGRPRSLLGAEQEAWLLGQLRASPHAWQLIGNQTLAFYENSPDLAGSPVLSAPEKSALAAQVDAFFGAGATAGLQAIANFNGPNPLTADSWTGYPSAKNRFLGTLAQARNPVILSGDSHNAWTANLRAPTPIGIVPIAPEFGGTSVTSPGIEQSLFAIGPDRYAAFIVDSSQRQSPFDKLIFAESGRRGFLLIDVTPARVRAEHIFVSTVLTPGYTVASTAFTVAVGSKTAVPA